MTYLNQFHGRILIVEDNADIATLLSDYLSEQGHIVDYAQDGFTGLHLLSTNQYDAVVLDLALPGIDGLTLCRRIRDISNIDVPILMLTAKDRIEDKLAGFAAGADDYLVKPFDLSEVLARLHALWRRSLLSHRQTIEVADLSLDLKTLTLKRAGEVLKLNPVRLKILRLLMENTQRVVSRSEIETYVWGDDLTESDALRTHLSAIRQAIDKPFETKLLHTFHGLGYRLCEEPAYVQKAS